MLVPLELACQQVLTEAKLPRAHDLCSPMAQSARRTCGQEMGRTAKLFGATDATQSVCRGPYMCKTMSNDSRNIAGRHHANIKAELWHCRVLTLGVWIFNYCF